MHRWQGVLLLALTSLGCGYSDAPPDLVRVLDVMPHEVELGERLEVVGTSFPQGVAGTVTLRGDLHAPGQRPRRGVTITLRGERTTHDRVSVTLTDALEAEICGDGEEARRTTFRGEVLVAFSPSRPAAPPLTGRLGDVVVVFDASLVREETAAADEAEAERLLRFVGLELEPWETTRSLRVRTVMPDGRAARAGLEPGDQLLEAEGVRLQERRDLLPAPGERSTRIAFQRGKLPDPVERELDIDGFRPAPPAELRPIAVLMGLVAAIVLAFLTPVAPGLTWVAARVAKRLRASAARQPQGGRWTYWLRELLRGPWVDDLLPYGDATVFRVVPYVAFIGVSAVSTAIAVSGRIVSEDLDLPLLWVSSTTGLLAAGLALGGVRAGRGWSLLAGLRMALSLAMLQIPAVVALACAALAAGSLRWSDFMQVQQGLPWRWLAFRDPVMLLAAALLLLPALPQSTRVEPELPEAELEPGRPHAAPGVAQGLLFCVEWTHIFVLSTLAAVVFFGGSELPLLSIGAQGARPLWQLLGVVVLELKGWMLVLLVVWLRWALPQVSVSQLLAPFIRWVLPLSAATLALSYAAHEGASSALFRSLHDSLGLITFGAAAFLFAYFVRRVLGRLLRAGAYATVNPWL